MGIDIEDIKGLKIVPENYESGTYCAAEKKEDGFAKIVLNSVSNEELQDYRQGEKAELFGLHKNGIAYFETEILEKNDNVLMIKLPDVIQEIQRRKYSRIPFEGKLFISGYPSTKVSPVDISAGGLRFISDNAFVVGKEYEIRVEMLNNLVINCTMQPIRTEENEDDDNLMYSVSCKFKKIRSIDRIALMQYSLRYMSVLENKA